MPNIQALSRSAPGVDVDYSGYRGRVVLAAGVKAPRIRVMMKTSTVLKATGRKEPLAAPFYWAPFILSGDSRPIEQ